MGDLASSKVAHEQPSRCVVTWEQVEQGLWTADVEGWALTVAPGPILGQGWFYSVEPVDGGLPTEMGLSLTAEQARLLAESAKVRLAAMPKT